MEPIDWTEVESSNILRIGVGESTGRLFVEFHKGSVYAYSGVSEEAIEEFKSADSVGKHFHEHIKGQFETEQIK